MDTLQRARPPLPPAGAHADRRKALALLAATSAIGGAGLAAGGTAGALVGAQLAGSRAAAGLPLGLVVLGSAGSALLISRQTSGVGRGWSLATGYLMGTAGALLVVVATIASSLTLLLTGSLLLGGANASIFLTRYAAAEIGDEDAEGRALGLILFSTAIGAVASPLLLGPSGEIAQAVGLPRLSGLFVVATVTFGLAALTLGRATQRPATRGVAALLRAEAVAPPAWSQFLTGTRAPPASLGLAVLVTANFVMVAFMAVAPIQLTGHGESLATVGAVISLHVTAMFGPSPLSGRLRRPHRAGRRRCRGLPADPCRGTWRGGGRSGRCARDRARTRRPGRWMELRRRRRQHPDRAFGAGSSPRPPRGHRRGRDGSRCRRRRSGGRRDHRIRRLHDTVPRRGRRRGMCPRRRKRIPLQIESPRNHRPSEPGRPSRASTIQPKAARPVPPRQAASRHRARDASARCHMRATRRQR